ncbi:MAG: GntR family transcriptional regulator [Acidimicrobiales bacterium]
MKSVLPGVWARRLDRHSALPLWVQLLDDLRRRLENGEFDDGFPSELRLATGYGVSRNTVREAMRQLRSEGAVVSGRGRLPQLGRLAEIEQPLGALYSLFASIEAAGLTQHSVVRTFETTTDAAASEKLGLRPDAWLLHLERIRVVSQLPLAVDHVWFPAEIGAPLLDVDFTSVGFYDELASRTGFHLTGGEEHIRAVAPDAMARGLLGIPPRVAALSIERIGYARKRRVEWRTTLVRGDRFALVATFSAGIGYRLGVSGPATSSHGERG